MINFFLSNNNKNIFSSILNYNKFIEYILIKLSLLTYIISYIIIQLDVCLIYFYSYFFLYIYLILYCHYYFYIFKMEKNQTTYVFIWGMG